MYNLNSYDRLLLIMLNVRGQVFLNAAVTIDRDIVQVELREAFQIKSGKTLYQDQSENVPPPPCVSWEKFGIRKFK